VSLGAAFAARPLWSGWRVCTHATRQTRLEGVGAPCNTLFLLTLAGIGEERFATCSLHPPDSWGVSHGRWSAAPPPFFVRFQVGSTMQFRLSARHSSFLAPARQPRPMGPWLGQPALALASQTGKSIADFISHCSVPWILSPFHC